MNIDVGFVHKNVQYLLTDHMHGHKGFYIALPCFSFNLSSTQQKINSLAFCCSYFVTMSSCLLSSYSNPNFPSPVNVESLNKDERGEHNTLFCISSGKMSCNWSHFEEMGCFNDFIQSERFNQSKRFTILGSNFHT